MSIKEKYKIVDEEYYSCIKNILENEMVKKMDDYIQHGKTTTLYHSILVSYSSYKIAKKFSWNYQSVARAALLHDFYLYDWHKVVEKKKLFEKHGFTHPQKALDNANQYFELNELEKDIILKHMWPLTFRKIPRYKESILVSCVDKISSTKETLIPFFELLKNKN